jgi:basic membrane lipoprotein Med (substrate-binding protein (PBP1-ABC) superfamily)
MKTIEQHVEELRQQINDLIGGIQEVEKVFGVEVQLTDRSKSAQSFDDNRPRLELVVRKVVEY